MAISSGAGQHFAWLQLNGQNFLIEKGRTEFSATKQSSVWSASIPIATPGVEEALGPSLGDNQAAIIVSTRGQMATLMTGEIDEVEFEYVGHEYCVTATGRDASAPLHEAKSAEKWNNKTPDQIISDIAGRVGLGVNIQSLGIKMQRTVQQDFTKLSDNISYASIVHKLCEFMGAHWYVLNGVLNVVMGEAQGSGYVVNYSRDANNRIVSDALSLTVKRNVQAGKPIQTAVKSWHPHEEQVFNGQNFIGGVGTPRQYVFHLPALTQDHVDQHALSKAQDIARQEIEVTAHLVGDPSIDPSQPLTLNGTSFAQSYTIDTLVHDFGSEGHTMTVVAKSALSGR